jgi:hypothetical protein
MSFCQRGFKIVKVSDFFKQLFVLHTGKSLDTVYIKIILVCLLCNNIVCFYIK